ncbi:hypothetical protein PR048_002304 [Dryococelus australis]|uniref:Uncharacterized protein n=1 Tax=Dryococelus australis TaxID=614101 RepID=A0ABQ9IJU6_9NEOP|nr:hypothetical protein PR048_002304 [Dryococelus australis]
MQPLDKVVMKPFKNAFSEACSMRMRKYPQLKISLKDIAGLVNCALTKVCRMELAQSAFLCTGIYPLNHSIFTNMDFHASQTEVSATVQEESPPPRRNSQESQTSTPHHATATEEKSPPGFRLQESGSLGPSTSVVTMIEKLSPLPSSSVAKLNVQKRRG